MTCRGASSSWPWSSGAPTPRPRRGSSPRSPSSTPRTRGSSSSRPTPTPHGTPWSKVNFGEGIPGVYNFGDAQVPGRRLELGQALPLRRHA
eukprot:15439839-Alexandrium_andersonii.AAC.1